MLEQVGVVSVFRSPRCRRIVRNNHTPPGNADSSLYYKVLCFRLYGMKVKLILPALTEATSPLFRPIKYSLFPPLGLATLAAYLDECDEVTITDEHVEELNVGDRPELVVIQVY